jgi:hypothetical protein
MNNFELMIYSEMLILYEYGWLKDLITPIATPGNRTAVKTEQKPLESTKRSLETKTEPGLLCVEPLLPGVPKYRGLTLHRYTARPGGVIRDNNVPKITE